MSTPRLTTLGGLAFAGQGEAAGSLARQRRKLALLVYLVRAARPVDRDQLADLLWGDEPDARARHSLSEALSHVRRALGADAVTSRTAPVALAPDAVDADVTAFDAHVAAGAWARAVAAYAGPFLDGVSIPRAPRFEQWAAAQRAQLGRAFARACEAECNALMRRRESDACAAVARRWLAEAPRSPEAALFLLNALKAPDTPAARRAALEAYAGLVVHLRAQDAEPDAAVTALAVRVRQACVAALPVPDAPARAAAAPVHSPASAPVAADTPAPAVASSVAAPAEPPAQALGEARGEAPSEAPARAPAHAPSRTPARTPAHAPARPILLGARPRRWVRAVGVAAGALLVLALTSLTHPSGAASRMAERPWVVVADAVDPLRDSVLDRVLPFAVAAGVAQSGDIDVVPDGRVREALRLMRRPAEAPLDEAAARDVAERVGATVVLVPGVARVGAAYVLTARLTGGRDGAPLGEEVARADHIGALLPAVDSLARRVRLRLGQAAGAQRRDPPLPQVSTASLPALRAYAAGADANARARYADAAAAYTLATRLDTTFAQAYVALGAVRYWLNAPAEGERAFAAAAALGDRLTPRERAAFTARRAQWRGDYPRAAAAREAWLAEHPSDREALGALAYTYVRAGRPRDAIAAYARLLAVDSTDPRDWINLAVARHSFGTPAASRAALAAYARAFALRPELRTAAPTNHEYGATLVEAGLPDSAAAVFGQMLGRDTDDHATGLRSLALLGAWRGAYGAAADSLRVAVTLRRAAGPPGVSELRDRTYRAMALTALGRAGEAADELRAAAAIARAARIDPPFVAIVVRGLARAGLASDARALQARLRAQADTGSPLQRGAVALADGEVALAEGRLADAERAFTSATATAGGNAPLAREALAWTAWRRGDLAAASARYTTLDSLYRFGSERQLLAEGAPYWLGRVAEARGDRAEAQRQYARLVARHAEPDPALVLVADARRRLAAGGPGA